MRGPSRWCWLFLFSLYLGGCQAGAERNASGSVDSGLAFDEFDAESGNRGRTENSLNSLEPTLDDVTNGLQNNSAKGARTSDVERGFGFTTFGKAKFADTNDDGIPDRQVPAERLLVHHGALRVEVARPEEAIASFRTQVEAWGGHLQTQTDTTVVVRVPMAHFEEAFAWVRGSGRVLSESRQAEDVTEEFLDLGIRLDNARKSRDRLLEVLQKADKVEDILKIEAELRRLTEEIERMEGRKKFLADQVALSTLSATFQALADAPVKKGARQPSRFPWINRIGAERVVEDFR